MRNGNVFFTTRFGEVAMADLFAYQETTPIPAHFTKQGNTWKISLGNYDKTRELIIDPLIYSTYIGGTGQEYGNAITVDDSGYVYITGYTNSADYDITPGAYQTTLNGSDDVFVTKLNPTGTGLIYSTYIGGSGLDQANAIVIDLNKNVYITGRTRSTDYNISSGAYQSTHGDGGSAYDVFVTKLNSAGNTLLYSTYIGGNDDDEGKGIAIDGNGNAYITGFTSSTDYDTTAGAFQQTYGGGSRDVFVTKLNPTGSSLIYSTYIGGTSTDEGNAIAIDANGNAYIIGSTFSSNYDVTAGSFQPYKEGAMDIFVTKLNSTGTSLIYSTYIGGTSSDYGLAIAIDQDGNAYITGETQSSDYDITSGAYQSTHEGGTWDLFVSKLDASGSNMLYSTYLGGSNDDHGTSIALDPDGYAYITGYTSSSNFDITAGAYQTALEGGIDVFVTKIDTSGTSVVYSTYLGGSDDDQAYGITLDGNDYAYITGQTWSTNYDVSTSAYQTTKGASWDVFVTKIYLSTNTSINLNQNNSIPFSIYPNPNNGHFLLKSPTPASFDLLDLTGKVIKTYHVTRNSLNVNESLAPGIYFIMERKSGATQKIIVR